MLYIELKGIYVKLVCKNDKNYINIQLIQTKLDILPEELKKEVLDYIDFLVMKHYDDVYQFKIAE